MSSITYSSMSSLIRHPPADFALERSITRMSVCGENNKYVFDDDKRPTLPYVAGACFEIRRHKGLTPFDRGVCYEFPEVSNLSDPLLPSDILPPSEIVDPIDNLTPWDDTSSDPRKVPPETTTERYLKHRPRKVEPHEDTTPRRVEVLRQIRVRDGAQVVQCRVDGIRGPLAAKIFDPLYRWEDVFVDALEEDWSPVGLVESEWSREAAAYERIRERGLDGRYTPRFEGCWSLDVPWELELELAGKRSAADHADTAGTTATTGGGEPTSERDGGGLQQCSPEGPSRRTIKVTRNVRLLLMEYIPGDSIINLLETGAYREIPPDVRMGLLARVGEAQSALWHIYVSQGDPHTRNVVVGRYEEDDEADDMGDVGGAEQNGHHPSSSSSSASLHQEEGKERPRKRQKRLEGRGRGGQEWRVALIDFGRSVVRDLPHAWNNLEGRLRPEPPLPPNPMTRCRGEWPVYPLCVEPQWDDAAPKDEANWIDKKHASFEARRKWMEARWGDGSAKAHLYQPVDYDKLDNPPRIEE